MDQILRGIAFIGGLLVIISGVIMILVVNETGYEPPALENAMLIAVFISGLSIIVMLVLRGRKSKE